MDRTVLGAGEVERRREFLQTRAAPGCRIEVRSLADGPASIESSYEAAVVVPELCQAVARAERDGFDAVIVGCFSDPGLEALRELCCLPVVGPGASALHLAAQLGSRFSVLSPLGGGGLGRVQARLRALGLADKLASVRSVGMPVLEVAQNRGAALERLAAVGRSAAREDQADVLVLGCMSMGFLGITEELTKELGLPVVNPVTAGLKTAEMVVSLGVSHSKAAYPVPPKLPKLEVP
ncbi:MAG TPA: aspartate/glutamate racemase family protein [Solirubrobacterales bacterium]|nr:aspartate/glutamate racemase family protein [Solirubrobacterales bacterium]